MRSYASVSSLLHQTNGKPAARPHPRLPLTRVVEGQCSPEATSARLPRMTAIEAVRAVWAAAFLLRARRRFAVRAGARRVAVEVEHPGGLIALTAPKQPRRSLRQQKQFGRR